MLDLFREGEILPEGRTNGRGSELDCEGESDGDCSGGGQRRRTSAPTDDWRLRT